MDKTKRYDDSTEDRANRLHEALTTRGIANEVHWDRSPWGVRIHLTDDDADRRELEQPSLFVLTEGTVKIGDGERWQWYGQLGGFGEDTDYIFNDTHFEWQEWAGVGSVVDALEPLVLVLKNGVRGILDET